MNNLIQLLIAAVLSSFGLAEGEDATLSTVGSEERIEMTISPNKAFLPAEEKEGSGCTKVFYFNAVSEG